MDRIEQAQRLLKDLERRCIGAAAAASPYDTQQTPSPGWFASVRYRLFGGGLAKPNSRPTTPFATSSSSSTTPFTRHIEEQIILADAYLSSAILTFLTQDITGYVLDRLKQHFLFTGERTIRNNLPIYAGIYIFDR